MKSNQSFSSPHFFGLSFIVLLNLFSICHAAGTAETAMLEAKKAFDDWYGPYQTTNITPKIQEITTNLNNTQAIIENKLNQIDLSSLQEKQDSMKNISLQITNMRTMMDSLKIQLTDAQKQRLGRVEKYKRQLENIATNIKNLYSTVLKEPVKKKLQLKTEKTNKYPYFKVTSNTIPITLIPAVINDFEATKVFFAELSNRIFGPLIKKAQAADKIAKDAEKMAADAKSTGLSAIDTAQQTYDEHGRPIVETVTQGVEAAKPAVETITQGVEAAKPITEPITKGKDPVTKIIDKYNPF
jgi:hypothetical protein